ncbi:putative duf1766-domain-containing protein [Eutypa lata UCREL1]|uniref:Putative duf1766-domain-containing protein n=1 Tax=Eutypa lata (strain UCR-EL1) TaxID=1287681 RepID=M7U1H1_EUTLA|nr:putative duf1766-domain-containing protein [Eutypa lata UCREL1]
MPFIPNTPESLLARSDSKNPDGTCRGVTGGGRPCRRPLAASPGSSPQPPRKRADRLRLDDPGNPDLYCWQHRDQAGLSARSSPGPGRGSAAGNRPILESRESVDTLIDRLGIVEEQQRKARHSKNSNNNTNNGGRKPSGQGAGRPSEKIDDVSQQQQHQQQLSSSHNQKSKKTTITTLFCCCFTIPVVEEEEFEHPQSTQHPQQQQQQQQQQQHTQQHLSELPTRPKPRPVQSAPAATHATAKLPSSTTGGSKKSNSTSGQNNNLLSLIPANTAPQTASQLLAELAKPPSAQDEPGYIYIFWLTPESAGAKPPTDAAWSLLTPPTSGSHLRPVDAQRQRRPSDVLANYAATTSTAKAVTKQQKQGQGQGKDKKKSGSGGKDDNTLLLKIGRATNVQRRLNEWTRQCGYDIDLIRYYPYVPSNPSSSSSSRPSSSASKQQQRPGTAAGGDGPRKTPHSHKVERLVHIELSGLGMRALDDGACAACGRAHREWFEVDASRRGIGVVDEIVRRWCDWDEGRL